jgi:signal transduction histidine kinase
MRREADLAERRLLVLDDPRAKPLWEALLPAHELDFVDAVQTPLPKAATTVGRLLGLPAAQSAKSKLGAGDQAPAAILINADLNLLSEAGGNRLAPGVEWAFRLRAQPEQFGCPILLLSFRRREDAERDELRRTGGHLLREFLDASWQARWVRLPCGPPDLLKVIENARHAFENELSAMKPHSSGLQGVADAMYRKLIERDSQIEVWSVVRILAHELDKAVGPVRVSASREICNFDGSATKANLDWLRGRIVAIYALQAAGKVPAPGKFDLADLIRVIASKERGDQPVEILLCGPRPMIVETDRDIIKLAVCSGLRNAVEATLDLAREQRRSVEVDWGSADGAYWLSIVDRGLGLPHGAQGAFEIFNSNKDGHHGMGLPIARRAMRMIEGDVSLTPGSDGGACFEIRWSG